MKMPKNSRVVFNDAKLADLVRIEKPSWTNGVVMLK